jgi:hypothetical protein
MPSVMSNFIDSSLIGSAFSKSVPLSSIAFSMFRNGSLFVALSTALLLLSIVKLVSGLSIAPSFFVPLESNVHS